MLLMVVFAKETHYLSFLVELLVRRWLVLEWVKPHYAPRLVENQKYVESKQYWKAATMGHLYVGMRS